jgi:hypothetical protein
VLAATDFDIFYAAMAKRNIMIQEQVLAMILASTGALPSSLTRDELGKKSSPSAHSSITTDDKQEQELLRLVMQKSTTETKPKAADQEFCLKTAKIAKQEADSLAIERQLLEKQMQHLVIEAKPEATPGISSVHSKPTGKSDSNTRQERKPTLVPNDSAAVTSEQAASNWLKSAQSESSATQSATHTALAASLSQLSPDEIRQRQEFLRLQRDKLLAMKKEARASQLDEAERAKGAQRPVSARTARSALSSTPAQQTTASAENDKKMAMRRAIAEKLRQEVIGKPS